MGSLGGSSRRLLSQVFFFQSFSQCSSGVEQVIRNDQVVGSNPTIGSITINGLWEFSNSLRWDAALLSVVFWSCGEPALIKGPDKGEQSMLRRTRRMSCQVPHLGNEELDG